MAESRAAKITGTWGGILSGVAALITAVGFNVFDTADEKAQKADDKSEMVLDLIRDQFKSAEKDRERLARELEYQRSINAKLFSMVTELRVELSMVDSAVEEESGPEPAVYEGGIGGGSSGAPMGYGSGGRKMSKSLRIDDPLSAAIEELPEEDQFDLPEPPPVEPMVQQNADSLPANLEDLISKK